MKVFQRDISFQVAKIDDQTVVVTNRIQDLYHDIWVEVSVDANTLVVKGIEAEYRKSPTPKCREMEAVLAKLVGLKIGPGFTNNLMQAVGGREGCNNVRNLLLSSLPLVMNVLAAAGIEDEQTRLDTIHQKLQGTCLGYSNPT